MESHRAVSVSMERCGQRSGLLLPDHVYLDVPLDTLRAILGGVYLALEGTVTVLYIEPRAAGVAFDS